MTAKLREQYGAWAVVTGASDGIGKAIALELAARGMNLFLVARRAELLSALQKEISTVHGVRAELLALDISNLEANKKLFDATRNLDVGLFVAAAGFGSAGEFINSSISGELNMIDLNCRSVVEQTFEFANRFKAGKRGGIILFSSLFAFQGVPLSATYSATKAFIQSFGEALSLELRGQNVDVLLAAPGPVLSGFGSRADMKMTFGAQPHQVASSIVNSLGRKYLVRPGFISKFLEFSLWLTFSRRKRSKILGGITKGMTAHQAHPTSRAI